MDIKVVIKMDKKMEAIAERIIDALGVSCCGGTQASSAQEEEEEVSTTTLLEDMKAEKTKKAETKKETKEEKKAETKETKRSFSVDDVRQALNSFTQGDKNKRTQAVAFMKDKFVDSGKLSDISEDKYGDLIAGLGEL